MGAAIESSLESFKSTYHAESIKALESKLASLITESNTAIITATNVRSQASDKRLLDMKNEFDAWTTEAKAEKDTMQAEHEASKKGMMDEFHIRMDAMNKRLDFLEVENELVGLRDPRLRSEPDYPASASSFPS